MSLTVDTKNAQSQKAKDRPYDVGMILLAIGLTEVTEKDLREVTYRMTIYTALFGEDSLGTFRAEDLIGVKSNVSRETAASWNRRMRDNFLRERT